MFFAAVILRRNPDSVVIPFDTSAYNAKIDPNDSILSIAERLAKYRSQSRDHLYLEKSSDHLTGFQILNCGHSTSESWCDCKSIL